MVHEQESGEQVERFVREFIVITWGVFLLSVVPLHSAWAPLRGVEVAAAWHGLAWSLMLAGASLWATVRASGRRRRFFLAFLVIAPLVPLASCRLFLLDSRAGW